MGDRLVKCQLGRAQFGYLTLSLLPFLLVLAYSFLDLSDVCLCDGPGAKHAFVLNDELAAV